MTEPTDFLEDFEPEIIQASHGKRLLNFVIDLIFYYFLIFLIGIAYYLISPENAAQTGENNEMGFSDLEWNVFAITLFLAYYILFEAFNKGRTLGKLITGSRAVTIQGETLSFGQAFKRSLIRLVPFEVFSYFGTPCDPWHDRWSDTIVMDVKKSKF